MSNLLLILLVCVLLFGITKITNNKNNLSPKVINLFIMMLLLLYITNNELYFITKWMFNFRSQVINEYKQIGILSPIASVLTYFISAATALTLTINIIGTIGLRIKSKIRMLRIIPFYMLLQYILLYKVSILGSGSISSRINIIMATILVLVLTVIYIVYRIPSMKRCFV